MIAWLEKSALVAGTFLYDEAAEDDEIAATEERIERGEMAMTRH